MREKIILIANPTSGRRCAASMAKEVLNVLIAKGCDVQLKLTEGPGDASKKAREAVNAGVDVVVGCGGDGTLQELAGVLVGTRTSMGIVPGGRCNDLAFALGINKKEGPEKWAANICGGREARIDLGKWQVLDGESKTVAYDPSVMNISRYFCTVATLGLDSQVSRFVEQRRLPIRGTLAYVYALMQVMLKFKPISVRIRGDFGERDERIVMAATGNTPYYGGAMRIAPTAKLDDGKFTLCLVKEVPKRTILKILPKVFSGKHIKHPAVEILDSSFLEFETLDGPEWICADGETLGKTPARLQIEGKSLSVRVASLNRDN